MEEIDLRIEAKTIVKEIAPHVSSVEVSNKLEASTHQVYINLLTKESVVMCIHLSRSGYQVGSNPHLIEMVELVVCYYLSVH